MRWRSSYTLYLTCKYILCNNIVPQSPHITAANIAADISSVKWRNIVIESITIFRHLTKTKSVNTEQMSNTLKCLDLLERANNGTLEHIE